MPREGIFARVLEGGRIANGDAIRFVDTESVG
jgi:MOSC domain-containing protein YiiM